MSTDRIKILAICGSLRESSSNSLIIKTVANMLPANVEYSIYHDMAKIPAFDDGNTIPDAVAVFRKLINGFMCPMQIVY